MEGEKELKTREGKFWTTLTEAHYFHRTWNNRHATWEKLVLINFTELEIGYKLKLMLLYIFWRGHPPPFLSSLFLFLVLWLALGKRLFSYLKPKEKAKIPSALLVQNEGQAATDDNLIYPCSCLLKCDLLNLCQKLDWLVTWNVAKKLCKKRSQRTCWPRIEWCSWGWNLLRDEVEWKVNCQKYPQNNFPEKSSSFSQVTGSSACCQTLDLYFEKF